ncbi:MAG: Na+/solute symporter [Verrucomicrobiaceae bacterium]|nr:Na+/solute symporter [Verrucomicrobiaceae bacterium]
MNVVATTVFVALFALVTVLGFLASRWKRADLDSLHEWGLAGRRFGTVITWFLLGGDLFTAYTFIALPALIMGIGAIGFFAVPYSMLIYPFAFVIFPRLWAVAHKHGYVTQADFVRARYGSPFLALLTAITGIVATMPYIALQLIGIQVIIGALGFEATGWLGELPLLVAFGILAAYTYSSGLRAPAMIAVVKDILVYITIIAAMIFIPAQLGGYAKIFSAVPVDNLLLKVPTVDSANGFSNYLTLTIGSMLAIFLYPHATTALFSASSGDTVRRNMIWLPAYSIVLGILAILGFMALSSGVQNLPEYASGFKHYGKNFAVPALFLHSFPDWFVGVAFAAIGIGALVPAAIMSIAAANLYTRNIHKEYINPKTTPAQETEIAKLVSLVVKLGALAFVFLLDNQYALNLQLLGGIWIIQTFPTVITGLYTRWFDHRGLVAGWIVGIGSGSWMAFHDGLKSSYTLDLFGYHLPGYAALYAFILNYTVAAIVTVITRAMKLKVTSDGTQPEDYEDQPESSTSLKPDAQNVVAVE